MLKNPLQNCKGLEIFAYLRYNICISQILVTGKTDEFALELQF